MSGPREGFQFNLDFDPPAADVESRKSPEAELEARKAQAFTMIRKLHPHERVEDLHLIPQSEIQGASPDAMLFRRPQNLDRGQKEMFFEVRFANGEPVEVSNPEPERLSFDDALVKGRKKRYH